MKQRRQVVIVRVVMAALLAAVITGCGRKTVPLQPQQTVELPKVISAREVIDVCAPSGPVPMTTPEAGAVLALSRARVVHYSSCENSCYWTMKAQVTNTSSTESVSEAELHLLVKLRDPQNPDDQGDWEDHFRLIPSTREPKLNPGASHEFTLEFGSAVAGKVVDAYCCAVRNEKRIALRKGAR